MRMVHSTKRWTLEEMHALPEDGNKYELVHGALYVTPAPTYHHETVLARLSRILEPYVAAEKLGYIYHPRAVFRIGEEVEVEPDLMVRQPHPGPDKTWETAPLPSLVVEVASQSTRRTDRTVKGRVYVLEAQIPEYWIIDEQNRSIRVMRPEQDEVVMQDILVWSPAGAREKLIIEIARVFDD